MLYKYINENSIRKCPNNGYAAGNAISNLPRYFANNPEIAKKEGYKPLEVAAKPKIDTVQQYLEPIYTETENNIRQEWIVKNIEEVIENENE